MPKGRMSRKNTGSTVDTKIIFLPCGKVYNSADIKMVNILSRLHQKKCLQCRNSTIKELGHVDTIGEIDRQNTEREMIALHTLEIEN